MGILCIETTKISDSPLSPQASYVTHETHCLYKTALYQLGMFQKPSSKTPAKDQSFKQALLAIAASTGYVNSVQPISFLRPNVILFVNPSLPPLLSHPQ